LKADYNRIAFVYDMLARLVYGKTLVNAQVYLLQAIPADTRILIIGGGTGWILEEIAVIQTHGLDITYVDSSEQMIHLAKARNCGGNKVTFVAQPIESISTETLYDVVITPFLLDNFTAEMMEDIFPSVNLLLRAGGKWLYADFQNTGKLWQQALLKIMYFFFRVFCTIPASKLPDAAGYFTKYGYRIVGQKTFMDGFVAAIVYEK
jgi:ubiquinone/menaquinone biosynthesis C-methylase UbiE